MKKIFLLSVVASFLILTFLSADASNDLQESSTAWKVGVARVVITPQESMWMAGYSERNHPSEGTLVDLWAKALVFEDASGNQAVLITTDLESFPKKTSDCIRDRLAAKFHLSRARIILNSSHTHSGPVLQGMHNIYTDDSQQLEKIERYTNKLEEQIVTLVGDALKSMVPAQLYAQNGVTRFQVNRRNNNEAKLLLQTELKGPNDYAVPVIKVVNEAGNLIAVVFGYACHNTVLDIYKWSGDYAGFAQIELEKSHPGVTALFFQGAGGDQNPLPRRTVPLAQQYGRELAAAVERVLDEGMRKLPSGLSTAYSEIELPFASPPTKEELLKIVEKSSDYQKFWAKSLLDKIERGEPIMTSYPYPVQVWQLGDQPIIILGGELVVEYAIELKRIFGPEIFVLGYSNDVMAYIPSTTIMREGGYEGASSQSAFGLPSTWASNIETVILKEVMRLAVEVGVKKSIK
jgi:hypothetical protein